MIDNLRTTFPSWTWNPIAEGYKGTLVVPEGLTVSITLRRLYDRRRPWTGEWHVPDSRGRTESSTAELAAAEAMTEAAVACLSRMHEYGNTASALSAILDPPNPHPDGCWSDPAPEILRDCESDGHYSCRDCARRIIKQED